MEVVRAVAADVVRWILFVIIYTRAGVDLLPEAVVEILAERAGDKARRVVRAAADRQVDLRLILEQHMAVFVQDGVGQLAPVARAAVFIIYVIVVDVDREAGVVRLAVLILDRRGIGEHIAVAVGIQVEFRDLDARLIRQDGAQEVPHLGVLCIADLRAAVHDRIFGDHVGDAERVVRHRNLAALCRVRQGDVFAVHLVDPAFAALLRGGRRTVHRSDQAAHLICGVAGLGGMDLNILQKAVAVAVVGVHRLLAVKPPHGIQIGVVNIGPAVAVYLLGIHQLPGGADIGFRIRERAAEIDHVLPGLTVGVALRLFMHDLLIGRRIRIRDLLHRRGHGLHRACKGVQVDLAGDVRRRVVEIAAPVLHHQNARHARQLEGGVVARGLRAQREGGVFPPDQVAQPVGFAVHRADHAAARAEPAQHIQLDIADHAAALGFGQGRGVVPRAVFAVFLVRKADEADLGIGRRVLHRLRDREQRGHARGVVVRAVGRRHAVMVRGHHEDIRICRCRRLDRDHVGAGLPGVIGIVLRADLIAHLCETALQVLRRRLLARRADRAVLRAQGLKVALELRGVRQLRVTLEDQHGFRHDDRVLRRKKVVGFAADQPDLGAPEHGVLRPLCDRCCVRVGGQLAAADRRLACAAVQHGGEFLPHDQPAGIVLPAADALDKALLRRPRDRIGIFFRHVGERHISRGIRPSGRLVQQLRRLSARDSGLRRIQHILAERKRLRPVPRVLRPCRPRRSGGRTGQQRRAQQHTYQFLLHLDRLIKQTVWFGFMLSQTNRPVNYNMDTENDFCYTVTRGGCLG